MGRQNPALNDFSQINSSTAARNALRTSSSSISSLNRNLLLASLKIVCFFLLHTCSSLVSDGIQKYFRWACNCILNFIISFDTMFHNRKYRQTSRFFSYCSTPINNFFYPSLYSLSGNNFWMAILCHIWKLKGTPFKIGFIILEFWSGYN